jgi:hypothetical protein
MPKILGEVPEYGIPSQESGLFAESLTFNWVGNWHKQYNNKGRICGQMLIDEQIDFSLSGAVALDSSLTWKGGAANTLVNAVPDLWCEKPETTTTVVNEVSRSYSNTDVVKADMSGSIMGFATSAE